MFNSTAPPQFTKDLAKKSTGTELQEASLVCKATGVPKPVYEFFRVCIFTHLFSNFPANIKHLYNICTMLDQRRRRLADVVQMLYKCFVFAGLHCSYTIISNLIYNKQIVSLQQSSSLKLDM